MLHSSTFWASTASGANITCSQTAPTPERNVIGFEAEGFRAKIYRTASWPIEEDANVQDNHHRRHTWEVNVSGRAESKPGVSAATDGSGRQGRAARPAKSRRTRGSGTPLAAS